MTEARNSQPKLDRIVAEHRALATLRLLYRAPGNRSNERIIAAWLEELGLTGLREQLHDMLDGFESGGFIRCERPGDLLVAVLTQTGEEVARGIRSAEGVLRPQPEEIY